MIMWFDRNGKRISESTWLKGLRENRVALTELPNVGQVSTIWLGLEHGNDERGKPLIFETRVTYSDGSADQRRYATEDEARAGHAEEVARLEATAAS
jgi:hypothetical protein